eukprot:365437-Chlamydomonas_euryale.AAC.2
MHVCAPVPQPNTRAGDAPFGGDDAHVRGRCVCMQQGMLVAGFVRRQPQGLFAGSHRVCAPALRYNRLAPPQSLAAKRTKPLFIEGMITRATAHDCCLVFQVTRFGVSSNKVAAVWCFNNKVAAACRLSSALREAPDEAVVAVGRNPGVAVAVLPSTPRLYVWLPPVAAVQQSGGVQDSRALPTGLDFGSWAQASALGSRALCASCCWPCLVPEVRARVVELAPRLSHRAALSERAAACEEAEASKKTAAALKVLLAQVWTGPGCEVRPEGDERAPSRSLCLAATASEPSTIS